MNQGQYENLFEQAQITNRLLREIADYLKEANERFAPVELSSTEEFVMDVENGDLLGSKLLSEVSGTKPTKGRKSKPS